MNRFDTIILSSTFISSIVILFIYIGFKVYNFYKFGQWLKGISTCEVFEILCFNNTSLNFIGNIEAMLFVPLLFLSYFFIHLLILRK